MKAEDLLPGNRYWVLTQAGWVYAKIVSWEPQDIMAPVGHIRVLVHVPSGLTLWASLEDLLDDDTYARRTLTT